MSTWDVVFQELQKEKSMNVLFFVYHHYYNRSIKDLSQIFNINSASISSSLNRMIARIRRSYEADGDSIGKDTEGKYDGHLIDGGDIHL